MLQVCLFYSRKRNITSLFPDNIERTSKKLKNIRCCRSAIPQMWNIPENLFNLWWRYFVKTDSSFKLLSIFAKNLHHKSLTGFYIHFWKGSLNSCTSCYIALKYMPVSSFYNWTLGIPISFLVTKKNSLVFQQSW